MKQKKQFLLLALALCLLQGLQAYTLEQMSKITPTGRAAGDLLGAYNNGVTSTPLAIGHNRAIVGAPAAGSTAGKAYILKYSSGAWVVEQELTPADATTGAYFGNAVAMSGDTLAVVGANDKSAAYVFAYNGTSWVQQTKLTPSVTQSKYGSSVAIQGGYLVVGCYETYFFTYAYNGSSWSEVQKVTPNVNGSLVPGWKSTVITGDYVCIDGSNTSAANGVLYIYKKGTDGLLTLQQTFTSGNDEPFADRLAASGDYLMASYLDSVRVYKNNSGTWAKVQTLASGEVAGVTGQNPARFGQSIALSGHYALIGSYYEGTDAGAANVLTQAGAAYLAKFNGTAWEKVQKIVPTNRAASDNFGWSVALRDSLALVAAPGADTDADGANTLANAGALYAFSKPLPTVTAEWKEAQQRLLAADATSGVDYGQSVAISGMYAIVGAPNNGKGAAYLLKKTGNTWAQWQKLTASDGASGDQFGYSVAISGNWAIVGAYNQGNDASGANAATSAGAVYLFKNESGTWSQTQKLVSTSADRSANDLFGYKVAIDGSTALVSATGEKLDAAAANSYSNAGAVYVLQNTSGTWSIVQKLVASDRAADDNFGNSLALHGSKAMVGSVKTVNSKINAGAAYVFEQTGSTWAQTAELTEPTPTTYKKFGQSVAISNNYALIGSITYDTQDGNVYVYKKTGSTWAENGELTTSTLSDVVMAGFGTSLALDSTYAAVGAPSGFNSDYTLDKPAVIMYKNVDGVWVEMQTIAPADASENYFGYALALDSIHAIVGAFAASNWDESGAVVLLQRTVVYAQSITFAALPEKAYGDAMFAPGATSNQGLTLTYTSGNPSVATITTDGKIEVLEPGEALITASQAGNDTVSAAESISCNLVVTKAPLTITVRDTTLYYGNQNLNSTVNYKMYISGFVKSETADVLDNAPYYTAKMENKNPVLPTTVPGTYALVGYAAADDHYSFSFTDGTLLLAKAPLAVTMADATRVYGQANPTFSYAYSGFVNSETKSVLDTEPTIACEATTTSSAGSYAISATSGADDCYEMVYTPGTLTVTRASLAATAGSKTKLYGTNNPTLTITYAGFVNSETSTVLATAPTATTTAALTSDAGTYDITLSGGEDENYEFTAYNKGTLTILQSPLTITANSVSRAFGEVNPDFTLSYSGFKNDDTEADIDTKPEISCTAVATSATGTYDIVLSGGADNNYSLSLVNGVLTVTPATATSTALASGVSLYPIPAHTSTTLHLPLVSLPAAVRMVDTRGNLVYTGTSSQTETTLDVSALPKGLYLLTVTDRQAQSCTLRVVVE